MKKGEGVCSKGEYWRELTALHCGTSLNELVNVKDLFQRTIEIVVNHQNTIGISKMNYNLLWRLFFLQLLV